MTEIIKNVEFSDFYLTMIRILKLIEIFENKDKYMLIKRKRVCDCDKNIDFWYRKKCRKSFKKH